MSHVRTGVRLRKIVEADLPAIAELLTEGFEWRPNAYWLRGLRRHAGRPRPEGYPDYGFCLDSGGVPVGVILLLFSTVPSPNGPVVRANVSSWYVKPEFRSFGSLLITSTTKDKSVTYFNVTPAPHTWSTVEAQGFSVYCKGMMYGLLALSKPNRGAVVNDFSGTAPGLSDAERDLLQQHAALGCLSVVVRDGAEGHPFIFQKHRVWGVIPVYRLLYCRNMDSFARYVGNLGRFLLGRGGALVRFDANQRLAGVVGMYTEKRGRKYAKGPNPPHLGDLAFTEAALFDS